MRWSRVCWNRRAVLAAAFASLTGLTPHGVSARDAKEVKIAVAANFTEPAKEIAAAFEKAAGHKLVLSFGAYVLGGLVPLVPLEQLPQLWSLPLADYLERSATPTGWGWLRIAHKADMGGLIGIALLAGCSLPPLAAVLVHARRHGDRVTAALCTAQIVVVLAAASGDRKSVV